MLSAPICRKEHRRSTPDSAVTRVALVFATDFDRASAGGIMTLLREVIIRLHPRFRILFVGVGDPDGGDAVRRRVGTAMAVLPVVPPNRRPAWLPLNVLFTLALFRKTRDISESADVIHTHRMETTLPFLIRKTKPVVLTVHGSSKFHAMTQTGPLRWKLIKYLYDRVEGFVFSRADRIILVSEEAHAYYRHRHPQIGEKLVVIPNFIDTSEFLPADRGAARRAHRLTTADTAVVYAGRLVQEKRVDVLIRAFALLLHERPHARLFIAGEGPDGPRLRQQVAKHRVDHVYFLGQLSKTEVRRLLAAADLLALPSRFEGFPMVALEALAYGVPVVASDVGGIREILQGALERFIWCSGDPRALMQKMLDATERRAELRDVCVARAGEFDTARILPRLEQLYDTLASARLAASDPCASA